MKTSQQNSFKIKSTFKLFQMFSASNKTVLLYGRNRLLQDLKPLTKSLKTVTFVGWDSNTLRHCHCFKEVLVVEFSVTAFKIGNHI